MARAKYKKRKQKAIKNLEQYRDKESSIERKVRLFLEKENIYYVPQYPVSHTLKNCKTCLYKVYDFMIEGTTNDFKPYKFLVEVDGSYFHAQDYWEGEKEFSKLTYVQKKNVRNDKLKNRIAKELGIPLLRIGENDVKYNFVKVIEEIYNMMN